MAGRVETDCVEAADELRAVCERSGRLVFFGGAGVSTASGIPDFRSPDGLYSQRYCLPSRGDALP